MAALVRPRPAGVFEDIINAVALRLPTACVSSVLNYQQCVVLTREEYG